MKAALIYRSRTVVDEAAFVEAVVWYLPESVPGSAHRYKYRLAFVVSGECVLRYDNERGKGDHRHMGGREEPLQFISLDTLFEAFEADMKKVMA